MICSQNFLLSKQHHDAPASSRNRRKKRYATRLRATLALHHGCHKMQTTSATPESQIAGQIDSAGDKPFLKLQRVSRFYPSPRQVLVRKTMVRSVLSVSGQAEPAEPHPSHETNTPPMKRSEKGTQKKTGKAYSIGDHPAKVSVNHWLASTTAQIKRDEGVSSPLERAMAMLSRYEVVVFDMDHTMSHMHCGRGLKLEELPRSFPSLTMFISQKGSREINYNYHPNPQP